MTYDSEWFARSNNPRASFSHHFFDGDATLISGDTMPVHFVTNEEIRTYKVVRVYSPPEHRWLEASKVEK